MFLYEITDSSTSPDSYNIFQNNEHTEYNQTFDSKFQDDLQHPLEIPINQEEEGQQQQSNTWIHEYLNTVKVRRNSLSNQMSISEGNDYCSPLVLNQKQHSALSNLPPAINETLISSIPDEYSSPLKNKKPLCRDTLIIGREHGLFGKKEDGDHFIDYQNVNTNGSNVNTLINNHNQTQQSSDKKKLHPLHAALKLNNQSTKTSPSLTITKTATRETHRALPPSQRYLVGMTTSSVGKIKKGISSPLGAVRGSQEWK